MDRPYVISLLFVLGLLGVGFTLRAGLKPLRTLFVPASVVGGLIGLAVMQAGLRVGPAEVVRDGSKLLVVDTTVVAILDDDGEVADYNTHLLDGLSTDQEVNLLRQFPPESIRIGREPLPTQTWAAEVSNIIDGWPGLLIAVVFAGLLIERPGKRFGDALATASRQGVVAYIIILGQIFLGLLATATLIAPFYDVPRPFGQLIEAGFAGGHGTAAAMGQVFAQEGFAVGRDLAFLFATVGLIYGVVSGIAFVNLGVRRGWLRRVPVASVASDSDELAYESRHPATAAFEIPVVSGLEDRADPPPAAFARVRNEVIDPLAFQLVILGAAFAAGYAMQQSFLWLAGVAAPPAWQGYIGNVPLFLFTLIGGWLVREAMHLTGFGDLIDAPSIGRLTGIAMEILIVAALANLRIEAAADFIVPVMILLGVGFAWTAFCLLYVSRKLLPRDYWFELGLINYGMSTATTAQGLLLLRIVDRDLESGAAEDYAAAAPLSAPFVGGGVLTVLGVPLALASFGYWPVIVVLGVAIAALWFVGLSLARRERATSEV